MEKPKLALDHSGRLDRPGVAGLTGALGESVAIAARIVTHRHNDQDFARCQSRHYQCLAWLAVAENCSVCSLCDISVWTVCRRTDVEPPARVTSCCVSCGRRVRGSSARPVPVPRVVSRKIISRLS
eukprot:4046350-Prymnesium_polylepis.1